MQPPGCLAVSALVHWLHQATSVLHAASGIADRCTLLGACLQRALTCASLTLPCCLLQTAACQLSLSALFCSEVQPLQPIGRSGRRT